MRDIATLTICITHAAELQEKLSDNDHCKQLVERTIQKEALGIVLLESQLKLDALLTYCAQHSVFMQSQIIPRFFLSWRASTLIAEILRLHLCFTMRTSLVMPLSSLDIITTLFSETKQCSAPLQS